MKKHFKFILLAAMAFTLLLPFQKPQTVQAADTNTVYVNGNYWTDDGSNVYYEPFFDTANQYSDASKFSLISENSGIAEPFNVKVSGSYGSGKTKLFTIEFSLRINAQGETDLDLVYNGRTVKEKFVNLKTQFGCDSLPYSPVVVPMYRIYNPNSGEHFYTSSDKEKAHLVSLGWRDEGIGWYAPRGDVKTQNGDPVYRLYNANGGEHHYTTDEKEKNALVSKGWKDEGIGWYSSPAPGKSEFGYANIYRLYNPNAFANNHNYTLSLKERDILVSLGWKDEGVAWYTFY